MSSSSDSELPPNPDQPENSVPLEGTPEAPAASAEAAPPAADELPEWEPLTPELVEDEAIRGDFVMRWAVVGLAILLGCSQIADTQTLVHVKTGEYLASHGILPPANDVFSYTRADQPWVNLSWLFDLIAAGVNSVGGGIALSIFQAILAAATFGIIVHIVRPGIRTWWGSICAALALLACFRQFTVQPELITLLGVALTLWILLGAQEGINRANPWLLVPTIWLWTQLDPRAFLGWGLVLLYGLGEAIGSFSGRPGFRDAAQRKIFWLVAAACVFAAVLNPFTYHAWLAPFRIYGIDYPAWQAAYPFGTRSELACYPMFDERFWRLINHEGVAALYLIGAAFGAMLLNARRVPMAHVAMFVGINAAAVFAVHELAAASLVNCVLATLNAQDWFLARYGQTYSTQWTFLLFSRGGRALTVLGMFGFAYLIISGRIDGPNGKRTGLGFDPDLRQQMASYEDAVQDGYDDRPFPFVIRQGDLLIWAGQKTFIDNRLELYYAGGDDDLIALHNKTRAALRRRQQSLPGSGDRLHWRKIFDDYQVTHVVPRMTGLSFGPNYRTFDDLLRSPDWKLTKLTATASVFYRVDKRQDQDLRAYVDSHLWDPVQLAFRQEHKPITEGQAWPSAETAYQRALSLPRRTIPPDVAYAAHAAHYATRDNLTIPQRLGALYAAIRAARAGLRADPNSSEGYGALGAAYSVLDQFEDIELQQYGVQIPRLLRYYQISSALQSASLLEPNNPVLHEELAQLYLRVQKFDLAAHHLQEFFRLIPEQPLDSEEPVSQSLEQMRQTADQLQQRSESLQAEIDKQLENGTERTNVAVMAYQNRDTLAAVRLLDEDKVAVLQSPPITVMYAGWLMEVGRVEEADQLLQSVEQQAGPAAALINGWLDNSIAAAWAQGSYERVAKLCEDAVSDSERRRVSSLLQSGPLSESSPIVLPKDSYPWLHVAAMEDVELRRPFELGMHLFHLALCRLEQGDLPAAQEALRQGLDRVPNSPLRPLFVRYWQCLTDERLEVEPPADWIPITKDLFAEESE